MWPDNFVQKKKTKLGKGLVKRCSNRNPSVLGAKPFIRNKLSELDFIMSFTPDDSDAECMFFNGEFSEGIRGEVSVQF